MRILLIEDEREIAEFIMRGLRTERFAVDWSNTGEEGLGWAKVNDYDIGIFDIRLPGMSGIEVCRALRERKKDIPIIMLSVMNDAITKVEALNAGADDYLVKPFFLAELLARMRALLRREHKTTSPILRIADLFLDTVSHVVRRGKLSIKLNRKEFSLLEYLMRHPGVTLTRGMILEHVWDMNADPFTNTVDVHIRFLRQKIDEGHGAKLIKTVHGYGYKIEA
jgi:two-component system OmpR family response regulator